MYIALNHGAIYAICSYDLNGPWLEVSQIWADYHYDLNTQVARGTAHPNNGTPYPAALARGRLSCFVLNTQVAHWLTMPGNRMREGQARTPASSHFLDWYQGLIEVDCVWAMVC